MSVTAAQGFRAAGVTAGLKDSGKPDISLVVNEGPSSAAAAVFTSNRCKAHPVIWSEQAIKGGSARAIILNSGGANCYTGPEGFAATHRTAERVAEHLGIGAIDVQVCSTGLIGRLLDEQKVLAGVDAAFAALSPEGGHDAATAIMTTDTVDKQATAGGDGWVIGGMAKGAGMLAPALATMLVVITTDADVDATTLDTALRSATAVSFDRLDSDGCQSTNDTVLVMASGASGVSPDPDEFTEALTTVCRDLALQLLADAEGADHEIAITTINAASEADALEVGRSVARSNLFKTAIYGKDPNWGRILASVGTTTAQFDPIDLDVAVNDVWVCRNSGVGESIDLVDLEPRSVTVTIDLKAGDHSATIWTNDLTHAYVHENSAYST
ncbi:bifunctional glutamate N-acetyltransferase/amino-acid acetyltransferase ArgJ [Aeromicrobium senzhongii]|uniref:Arginine biosynthesis bifunctional protein ArgJ n=1 Tax=Aeromicrobium senzhongii TaxID=2663859 RepID=A0ABX6SSN1_9ACTN|nr:bifunctional glutamate N-acetyltransferase/amino-acid acetyltransferase ArgJ [Aeromicrobium senzhongii]MTB89309.1 bifunctional glutamate N-acetyltransferase/amino-acid acetyltransferase ArgJ [Aeromicrobium senzhongii]QNL93429.1 bifunctional glutamate N-acetyltransferase/amino-acid acetyltransferase ArgJ [Aeromicrobium senzhongii]